MDSLEYSEQMRDSLVDFLSRLIKTPSLSGHEENVVALIRDEMEKLGFDLKPTQSAICAVMLYDARLSQDMAAKLLEEATKGL